MHFTAAGVRVPCGSRKRSHHKADYIFIPFGIIEPIMVTLKIKSCLRPPTLLLSDTIATDKVIFFNRKMLISFLFLNKNICCGYSLEAPRRGASNEYPQHMFSSRNKKSIMWIPPLIYSYVTPPRVLCFSLES